MLCTTEGCHGDQAPTVIQSESFLAQTNGGRRIVEFSKGQIVFSRRHPAVAVFYVRTGKVKVHNSLLSVVLNETPSTVKPPA
jgi:CRP-like cAMP-binding protein